jgi:hypothetical protein
MEELDKVPKKTEEEDRVPHDNGIVLPFQELNAGRLEELKPDKLPNQDPNPEV